MLYKSSVTIFFHLEIHLNIILFLYLWLCFSKFLSNESKAIFRGLVVEMEKEMATHSSILAWRIPGTVEPGGLLSMGSHRDTTEAT